MKSNTLLLPLLLLFGISTFAQNDTMKANKENPHIFFATAKFHYTNNLHDMEGMSTVNLKIASNVSPTVINAFYTAFKNASNDKWFYHDKREKVYLVKFNNEEKDYKALMNKKGKLSYVMYDGSEKDLSNDTKKNIKAWYADFNIVGMVKVNAPSKDASIVNLKHDKDLIILSLEDDLISEVGRYRFDDVYVSTATKKSRNTSIAKK